MIELNDVIKALDENIEFSTKDLVFLVEKFSKKNKNEIKAIVNKIKHEKTKNLGNFLKQKL